MRILYRVLIFLTLIASCELVFANYDIFAQDGDLELSLDVSLNTVPLPKIFKPNIDLSGRGFNRDSLWPQELAAKDLLAIWQKDIGFGGLYRLQYNLWEIDQLSKNRQLQNKLLSNYESAIKNISDNGGTVILDLFGTPAGMGKVLDKNSPPADIREFKSLVKGIIRELSCNKKYNIWYEVWNAPDLDEFFLGRKQEYFNLYRAVAESVKELENETKINIPVGGPSVSWWFQNTEGNNILTPERSLIYELIKYCYKYRLPLDFISWHSYSTNPAAEKESTIYKKSAVTLIREWLSYFNFDKNTPLIVDEWNFDRSANVLPERREKSYITASYIPARIRSMHKAGIDYQLYFSMEDFQNNKEAVVRNVGVFFFDPEYIEYKGGAKSIYNSFLMLANLKKDLISLKINDEFVGAIATKSGEDIAVIIYNYIDPEIATNFLSMNIASLNAAERKALLNIINSDRLGKILLKSENIASIRTTKRLKELLNKALELNERAKKFLSEARNLKLVIKGLKDNYAYQRYLIDSSCSVNCKFEPAEQKDIVTSADYQEPLSLSPYSVQMVLLKKKSKEEIPTVPQEAITAVPKESEEKTK